MVILNLLGHTRIHRRHPVNRSAKGVFLVNIYKLLLIRSSICVLWNENAAVTFSGDANFQRTDIPPFLKSGLQS